MGDFNIKKVTVDELKELHYDSQIELDNMIKRRVNSLFLNFILVGLDFILLGVFFSNRASFINYIGVLISLILLVICLLNSLKSIVKLNCNKVHENILFNLLMQEIKE